ncbi:MAG: RidA family protein [Rhizobiaceae bacterium]
MSDIARFRSSQRMSQIVIHGDTIYLAGQVGTPYENAAAQTREILDKIDALLAEAGSDKTKVLRADIWLSDMRFFEEMNKVWDAWVAEGHAPARACGSASLATAGHWVEILVVAAK